MNKPTDFGPNRTGLATSPLDSQALIDGARNSAPTSPGDEQRLADARALYVAGARPIGSMPPPATVKGALKTAVKMIAGEKPSVFLDKLGERLAFERGGTRLYQALIGKVRALGAPPDAPPLAELEQIMLEEMGHFELARQAMERLGADPTALTPEADLVGQMAFGMVQVIADPRTTPAQAMGVILTVELTDNDGWQLLADLAREIGQADLAQVFRSALVTEERHLEVVRSWLSARVIAEARGEAPPPAGAHPPT